MNSQECCSLPIVLKFEADHKFWSNLSQKWVRWTHRYWKNVVGNHYDENCNRVATFHWLQNIPSPTQPGQAASQFVRPMFQNFAHTWQILIFITTIKKSGSIGRQCSDFMKVANRPFTYKVWKNCVDCTCIFSGTQAPHLSEQI